jgi:NAD-dependent dihydropyrimidine dehydrogenase PreA subunit
MSFVVADKCIGTVDHSCVEVCPVDCIYDVGEDPENPDEPLMVVIDPEECIGCGACVPECPVEAIAPIELVHLDPAEGQPSRTDSPPHFPRTPSVNDTPRRRT